jgi:RNA-directed DNA polymerase
LANIYLHQIDKEWIRRGMDNPIGQNAQLVRYADDLVILSNMRVDYPLKVLCEILSSLDLKLSSKKTRIVKAEDSFDFLGFRFKREYSEKYGKRKSYYFPSPKSIKSIKRKIREYAGRKALHVPPEIVVRRINIAVQGWLNYFTRVYSRRSVNQVEFYLQYRFRVYLRRRVNKHGLGRYRDLPEADLVNKYGLNFRKKRLWQINEDDSYSTNAIGEPYEGEPHVRFDEGPVET